LLSAIFKRSAHLLKKLIPKIDPLGTKSDTQPEVAPEMKVLMMFDNQLSDNSLEFMWPEALRLLFRHPFYGGCSEELDQLLTQCTAENFN
jgi:hypothetical protein